MADNPVELKFENTLTEGMQKYFTKMGVGENKGADEIAKKKIALQLLDYVIQGSPRENITAPLLYGTLRQSASVFVGSILVKANGADANRSYSANPNTITVGFDVSYAARMHEHLVPANTPDPIIGKVFQPGERTTATGGGGKFVELHLKADGQYLIKLYADMLKKEGNN